MKDDASSLSDKIHDPNFVMSDVIRVKDVKESVKKLKEELDDNCLIDNYALRECRNIIDKIFGKDLI